MARPIRMVALCIGRPGDEARRWHPDDVQRLLRPSPATVPGAQRVTVGDFWFEHTDGRHDLGAATALPWLELDDGHPAWADLALCAADFTPGEHLRRALQHLVEAASADPGRYAAELRSAEAILVVTTSGSPLAWSQYAVLAPGVVTPCAHVPLDVTHTTLSHEVGHLLGFTHSFGLSTEGLGREYGDPYCIMSARRFGGRTVQVTRPLPGTELLPGAALWSMVGPGLARATAWAHQPSWPAPTPDVSRLDRSRSPCPVTIAHAGAGEQLDRQGRRHPRLVAIPQPGTTRWLTLEVRGALPAGAAGADWDAAFRLDREPGTGRPADRDPQDAPGIVVHEVDAGARVTYRGTVPLPLGGDTDLSLGEPPEQLTIRATGYRNGVATVLLSSVPGVPMAWARVERPSTGPPSGHDPTGHDPTGHDRAGRTVVHAITAGYVEPVFSWRVNGTELAAGVRLGDDPVSTDPARTGLRAEVLWDGLVVQDDDRVGIVVEVEVFEGAAPGRQPRPEPRCSRVTTGGVDVRCRAW